MCGQVGEMMHLYSRRVHSVVSICLRFIRPSSPVLENLLPTSRLYCRSAYSGATAAQKLEPLAGSVSNDSILLENRVRVFTKTFSGLNINRRHLWTSKQIALLNEGVELRRTSKWTWNMVAELVGGGVSAVQCRKKGENLNQTFLQKQAEWDSEEIALLSELVKCHTDPVTRHVAWKHLSTVLNRPAHQISSKWAAVNSKNAVRFSPEQDALIQKRVAAWGVKAGLWASLQREFGFRASVIRTRYYKLLVGTSDMVYFTPEMDQVILDERKVGKLGGRLKGGVWSRIAALVGPSVTANQCKARWTNFLRHKSQGLRVGVDFTQVELARIAEFADEHGPHGIPWTKLGKELNVVPHECQVKWREMRRRNMKKGYFSAEEDALLLTRVKEWGDPRQRKGLWVALEKEMHRSTDSLSKRWNWLFVTGSDRATQPRS